MDDSPDRARLVELLNTRQGLSFTGSDAKLLSGPIVYVLFRGEQVMYVGMSRSGIGRPCYGKHAAIGGEQLRDSDVLQVWPMASEAEAREVERLLIWRLRPAWNKTRVLPRCACASARIDGRARPASSPTQAFLVSAQAVPIMEIMSRVRK